MRNWIGFTGGLLIASMFWFACIVALVIGVFLWGFNHNRREPYRDFGGEIDYRYLRGIKEIVVFPYVFDLGEPHDSTEERSKKERDLAKAITTPLKQAGVNARDINAVVPHGRADPDSLTTGLIKMFRQTQPIECGVGQDMVAYLFLMEFDQSVRMKNGMEDLYATTWCEYRIGVCQKSDIENLRAPVQELVREFIGGYKSGTEDDGGS